MAATLADLIAGAARAAFSQLLAEEPGRYYYCSLITTGDALPPVVTAWSYEALERAVLASADPEQAGLDLKWSWGESPYMDYGADYFAPVQRAFDERPQMDDMPDDEADEEYEVRLAAMEAAMKRLDEEGVFGTGQVRDEVVVLVETVPPDWTNTERAHRLNPEGGSAFRMWLDEAAEPEP